jgi:hypothetical protein
VTQVGGAFVRIRPVLDPEERRALERLRDLSRDLADGLDNYLSKFVDPHPRRPIEKGET